MIATAPGRWRHLAKVFFGAREVSILIVVLAVFGLKQVLGLAPSGSQTILSLGSGVAVSVLVCAAIAVFDGSGSPGARWAGARLDRLAPQWLQYGACIFLLATLSGAQGGKFIYGQF